VTTEAKAEEMIEVLRGAFVATIATSLSTLPPHDALKLASSLCTTWLETLRGLRVTHRAKPPIDPAAVAEDWLAGTPPAEIQRKHQCSLATAYRYHPARRNAA